MQWNCLWVYKEMQQMCIFRSISASAGGINLINLMAFKETQKGVIVICNWQDGCFHTYGQISMYIILLASSWVYSAWNFKRGRKEGQHQQH